VAVAYKSNRGLEKRSARPPRNIISSQIYIADQFLVPVDRLRPTQAAVGMRTVAAKRQNVERRREDSARIEKFLTKRPIPAVKGPGRHLYIIDHHHLGLALWQAEIQWAVIELVDDLSHLRLPAFWERMVDAGTLHPFDEQSRPIHPSRLPKRLGDLRHDPYRDLATSVRQGGGFLKSTVPYSEFSWANHFRERIPLEMIEDDYGRAVRRAMALARKREAATLPGFLGREAKG